MRRNGLLLLLVLLTPVASALEGLAPEQPQVQLDAIDGNQTAKTHAQVVYFK